jgi:hypothetical protein
LLCQKKKLLNVLVKTNAKANLLPLKQVNLYAKKWSTSGRANMALDPLSKPLPLGCPRRGGLE